MSREINYHGYITTKKHGKKIKQRVDFRETVYNVSEYSKPNTDILVGSKGREDKKICYIQNLFCTFDIETTTIYRNGEYEGFMYLFQLYDGENLYMGRRWSEAIELFEKIKKAYKLHSKYRMVVYVHFLAYETQFMQSFFKISELFAKSVRKPLYYLLNDAFEFRCSYFLSNMSLKKFCENSANCKHFKLDGDEYNYNNVRTPDTYLSDQELGYGANDVIGLHECIIEKLKEDKLTTIPLTSTGYVRRDCRRKFQKSPVAMHNFREERLNAYEYNICRNAFRGGDVAANRYHIEVTHSDIDSYDFTSDYLYLMMTQYFPTGKTYHYYGNDPEFFKRLLKKYCVIAKYEFININAYKSAPNLYIDLAHVKHYRDIDCVNGRIVSAKYIEIYLTELDLKIIENAYDFGEYIATDVIYWKRGVIEKEIKENIMSYFINKTSVDKSIDLYKYAKSKNLLNAIFGMYVSDIVHDIITLNKGEWKKDKPTNIDAELDKYYESYNSFLSYQKGVYVTAHARFLLNMFLKVFKNNAVYWDTDSIKGYVTDEIRKIIEKYNSNVYNCNLSAIDPNGKKVYLGEFLHEGKYAKFKTLGPKKYAMQYEDGKYNITLAGVPPEKGVKEILDDMHDTGCDFFEVFDNGKIFKKIDKTTMKYNDDIRIRTITVNGSTFQTGANIAAYPATYSLGVSEEYGIFKGVIDIVKNSGCV